MTTEDGINESAIISEHDPALCHVCGVGDDGRRLCHFIPNEECPEEIFLHVFCGKTAGILPHVNRPDLEILTKAGVKNKHGTGVSVTLALQRCRSSRVNDPSNREQEYYLSKEFERIYLAVTKEPAHADDDNDAATAASGRGLSAHHSNATSAHHHHHHHSSANHNAHHQNNNHLNLEDMTNLQPQTVPNPMYSTGGGTATTAATATDHHHFATGTEHQHADQAVVSLENGEHSDEPPSKRLKPDEPKSPYDIEMERLQLVCDRCSGVGYSLIRGVARTPPPTATTTVVDSEGNETIVPATTNNNNTGDDVDDENFDPTKCSQEQVDHVRVIVITKERQDRMEEMSKLILGEQHGQELMTFNTSFSYQVIKAWNAFTVRFHEASATNDSEGWQEKFDLLLGFTDTLKEHDVWMHDHEEGWGGEKMVKQLALSWSLVLKRSNEELGIDSEYTRPGIVALLEQFKEAVEMVETHDVNEAMTFEFS